jgi:hypothetical protein
MVASHDTVEQMLRIILKYVDKKTAHHMVRDLYQNVNGNKSIMETLLRLRVELTQMLHDEKDKAK